MPDAMILSIPGPQQDREELLSSVIKITEAVRIAADQIPRQHKQQHSFDFVADPNPSLRGAFSSGAIPDDNGATKTKIASHKSNVHLKETIGKTDQIQMIFALSRAGRFRANGKSADKSLSARKWHQATETPSMSGKHTIGGWKISRNWAPVQTPHRQTGTITLDHSSGVWQMTKAG